MTDTLFIGLTGSIGMGKSTTSDMFRNLGVSVYDADAAVHDLYAGEAAPLIEARFPGTTNDQGVDRNELSKHVIGNETAMKELEAIVHPLVQKKNLEFRKRAQQNKETFAILDIPLLFETGGDKRVDGIVVVTAPADVQRKRVMSRPGMTEAKFEGILKRQLPDAEKRKRADFIVDTSQGMDVAKAQVKAIVTELNSGNWSPTKRSSES